MLLSKNKSSFGFTKGFFHVCRNSNVFSKQAKQLEFNKTLKNNEMVQSSLTKNIRLLVVMSFYPKFSRPLLIYQCIPGLDFRTASPSTQKIYASVSFFMCSPDHVIKVSHTLSASWYFTMNHHMFGSHRLSGDILLFIYSLIFHIAKFGKVILL